MSIFSFCWCLGNPPSEFCFLGFFPRGAYPFPVQKQGFPFFPGFYPSPNEKNLSPFFKILGVEAHPLIRGWLFPGCHEGGTGAPWGAQKGGYEPGSRSILDPRGPPALTAMSRGDELPFFFPFMLGAPRKFHPQDSSFPAGGKVFWSENDNPHLEHDFILQRGKKKF